MLLNTTPFLFIHPKLEDANFCILRATMPMGVVVLGGARSELFPRWHCSPLQTASGFEAQSLWASDGDVGNLEFRK